MPKAEIKSAKCGVLTIKLLPAGGLTLPDPTVNRGSWSKIWRPYVIAECQGFWLSSEALDSFADKEDVFWIAGRRPFKFDISPSRRSLAPEGKKEAVEELTISLFVTPRELNTSTRLSPPEEIQSRSQFLGSATIKPLLLGPGWHKVVLKNGVGKLHVEISFVEKALSPLPTRDDWMLRKGNQHTSDWDLVHVEKKYSSRSYGMEVIDPTHPLHGVDSKTIINLVSILEYLHAKNIIVGCLKMENILLNSSGHVSLCKPSLFGVELSEDREENCILPGTASYPAPETLFSESRGARDGDWWSLGVILYELLTGAPPFYHKDIAKRWQRIIYEDLYLPATLPPSAKDILNKLLEKNAANQLGANGAAEVKAHPFFEGLDWEELVLCRLEPPFKPHDATVVLWREPRTYGEKHHEGPNGEIQEMGSWLVELTGDPDWEFTRFICALRLEGFKRTVHKSASKDNYALIWETADGESDFYFRNHLSGERTLARRKGTKTETSPLPVAVFASEHPRDVQKQEALLAAMEAGYGIGAFPQLLGYGLNLNTQLLNCTLHHAGPTTALEWAVEDEGLDLVHLFLDHGADADFPIPCREGSALVHRVARTRALALAVEQEDITLVTTLLAHGVPCDFEESDRPPSRHPFFWDYCESRALEEVDVTPALVRAARLGNLAIVKLLLDHGADPNVAYHDLGGWNNYKELGDEVLVEAGADVEVAQPVWDVLDHFCQPVPRGAYLEIWMG
ncbi:hypothetical protein BJX62DRAFT_250223 [Aspergillus germanicus]